MWIRKPQKQDFRFRWSIYIVLFAVLMFTAARFALFEWYRPLFEGLSSPEIRSAFFNGLRFDFSCIALFLGPLIFLLNLPVNSRRWAKWLLYIISLVLLIMAGVLAADLIYFPKVNRHIAEEIVQISHDWDFVISYMFGPACGHCWGCWRHLRLRCCLYVIKLKRVSRRILALRWRKAANYC